MMQPSSKQGLSTRGVWGGKAASAPEGATVMPVFHGVTFAYEDLDEWRQVAEGTRPGHIYSRNTNPTVQVFERTIQALEGAEAATSFATGMAAISNTFFALLSPGDRVVSIRDTYGGTNRILTEFLPEWGVEVTLCATEDHEAMEREIGRGCTAVYLETPTNPTLKILDVARLARSAKEAGALVMVDNTFATPINQRPLELGADLVLYSATKFLGGHSDAMGGAVLGARSLVERIFRYREINGASLDPNSAFLLSRGLATLELRMERHNRNAQRVAEFLVGHPAVGDVFYPGLPSHPGHDVAREQMSGFGGVLAFSLRDEGPPDEGRLHDRIGRFLGGLRLAHRAASLGSVATLVGPPSVTSHVELTPEGRARAGIPESLIRYSVGIENAEDLIRDLDGALHEATDSWS